MGGPFYYALKREERRLKDEQSLKDSLKRSQYAISLSLAVLSIYWGTMAYQSYQKNKIEEINKQTQTVTNLENKVDQTNNPTFERFADRPQEKK